jgi:hypothetical protein
MFPFGNRRHLAMMQKLPRFEANSLVQGEFAAAIDLAWNVKVLRCGIIKGAWGLRAFNINFLIKGGVT